MGKTLENMENRRVRGMPQLSLCTVHANSFKQLVQLLPVLQWHDIGLIATLTLISNFLDLLDSAGVLLAELLSAGAHSVRLTPTVSTHA